jgi:hypothetical protein
LPSLEQQLFISNERTVVADSTLVNFTWSFADGWAYQGYSEMIISGNSIFDPGVGISSGLNPVGYVFWNNAYYKYRVLSSTIVGQFSAAVSDDTGAYVVIFPSNVVTGVASLWDAEGQPYSRKGFFNPLSGNSKAIVRNHMSTAKLYGQRILEDDRFAALFSTVPANEWFWSINFFDPSATASNGVSYNIKMVYKTLLFDRKPQIQEAVPSIKVPLPVIRNRTMIHQENNSCFEKAELSIEEIKID